jgi:hypothetical protein
VVIRKQAVLALLLVMGTLWLGVLACTSDQEWIIPRTTPELETQFQVGDTARVVGSIQVLTTVDPDPSSSQASPCFNNTIIEVLAVSEFDGVIYYQVDCGVNPGWLSEELLQPQ